VREYRERMRLEEDNVIWLVGHVQMLRSDRP
jgi:hypothetical protein